MFLPLYAQIGEILKKKFDQAQEVRQRKRRGRRMLEPRFQRFKPHTDTDLVFLKDSPTYCDFNVNEGSLGTHGRECNPVSTFRNLLHAVVDSRNLDPEWLWYFPCRKEKAPKVATPCAAIEASWPEPSAELSVANANFIGVALFNAKSATGKWKWAPATK